MIQTQWILWCSDIWLVNILGYLSHSRSPQACKICPKTVWVVLMSSLDTGHLSKRLSCTMPSTSCWGMVNLSLKFPGLDGFFNDLACMAFLVMTDSIQHEDICIVILRQIIIMLTLWMLHELNNHFASIHLEGHIIAIICHMMFGANGLQQDDICNNGGV